MNSRGPQLIAYADRLGGTISGLADLLDGPLAGAFGGVHVLPFFTPYDGVDAGFDPRDHTVVDPRLGSWDDVRRLAVGRTVMADVIVNHVSAQSAQFLDVRENGEASEWAPMFLTLSSVFPDGATEADLARIYRPRPGLPFTAMQLGAHRRLVWTTFTPDQVDIDLRTVEAWDYLQSVVDTLTAGGVSQLRLDAVGYTGKEAGTDCFMTPSTDQYTARVVRQAHARGASVLVEVHGHHTQQMEIARKVDYVYDFALPPLVLHALTAGDLAPLHHWLTIRPSNAVTVLDTHDGIGIVDVGPSDLRAGEPGLLTPEQIDALVEAIHTNSSGTSRLATGAAASNLDLYQVNCTFYDALARDDARYVLARLIQLFVPGIPQVYYVGLFAGTNDVELLERTGVGRDVNRHHYTSDEIEHDLSRPAVRAQLGALRVRTAHPAFEG
ncbi:MAG: sucrose phosphorylase, partial [Aeromicrobium sp.]